MKNKKNILFIIIIFVVTCIMMSMLFVNQRYSGHDTVFHVSNIIKLSETISLNNIFGDDIIQYDIDNFDYGNFGYGIGLFYPKIPHLLGTYLYIIFKDVYLSMNIIYFVTTFLSGVFVYFLSNKIYKNKNISVISSLIYITFPYHICEIYVRDAFAENFMFMVLPMIFLGLYNLKDGNYFKFYILFILGYVIGMNSHLVSMVFYTLLIGIFIVCYWKCFFKKDKFLALVKSTLIVTFMLMPNLVTLIEHKKLELYRVFSPIFININGVLDYVLDVSDFYSFKAMSNGIMPYLNMSTIILFLLTTLGLFFFKKDKYKKDKIIVLTLILFVGMVMCSDFIWKHVPQLLLSIQFPWRLLVFFALMISLYTPGVLVNCYVYKYSKYIVNICLCLLMGIIIYEGYSNIKFNSKEYINPYESVHNEDSLGFFKEYYPFIEAPLVILGNEYFPKKDYRINTDENIKVNIFNDNFPNMEFEISDLRDVSNLELPRTFYLGYQLIHEDGEIVELSFNHNGLLTGDINKNGKYVLNYDRTKLCNFFEIVRLVLMFIICLVLVVKYIKCKRKRLQF